MLLLSHINLIRGKAQWLRSSITIYVEHNLGFEVLFKIYCCNDTAAAAIFLEAAIALLVMTPLLLIVPPFVIIFSSCLFLSRIRERSMALFCTAHLLYMTSRNSRSSDAKA